MFCCQVYRESFISNMWDRPHRREEKYYIDIFDGFTQITFYDSRKGKLFVRWNVVVHKNIDSLNNAKIKQIVLEHSKKIKMKVQTE